MNTVTAKELVETSTFLINEIVYLNPSITSEKVQGREMTRKLIACMELLEIADTKNQFVSRIELISYRITKALSDFK